MYFVFQADHEPKSTKNAQANECGFCVHRQSCVSHTWMQFHSYAHVCFHITADIEEEEMQANSKEEMPENQIPEKQENQEKSSQQKSHVESDEEDWRNAAYGRARSRSRSRSRSHSRSASPASSYYAGVCD